MCSAIRLLVFLSAIGLTGVHYANESTDRVMPLLKGYEWQFDSDKFAALPPDSYHALLQIAGSRDHPGFIRERAMVALRIYPNDEVWAFFNEAVSNAASNVKRRRAVQGMCQAFAETHSRRVEDAIAKMLDAEDPHLRVRVARCLKSLDSESAREKLSSYRSKISESWELEAVDAPARR